MGLLEYLKGYIDLNDSESKSIAACITEQELPKNGLFLKQGQKCNNVAFLLNGAFRVFHTTKEGEEANTEFILSAGFITDFMSFLRGTESNVTITAMEKSTIEVLEIKEFQPELLKKLAYFGKNYVQHQCLPKLLDYQVILSEKPETRYQMLEEKYPEYLQKVPQKHLASFLRLRPETISRIKKDLLT